MIVANGLSIVWFKCSKWHLAKTMGSLGLEWFVCRFQLDASLYVDVVCQKKRTLKAKASSILDLQLSVLELLEGVLAKTLPCNQLISKQ